MKIVCVGNDSVVLKSDNALLESGEAFYLSEDSECFTAHLGIAVRVCQIGKSIPQSLAQKYYDRFAFALNIEKESQKPDALSQSFDYSFCLGAWQDVSRLGCVAKGEDKASESHFEPSEADITERIAQAIERVSAVISLKVGDLVFVPLSTETKTLKEGDVFSVRFLDAEALRCEVR